MSPTVLVEAVEAADNLKASGFAEPFVADP
jgi:hypothetical protein